MSLLVVCGQETTMSKIEIINDTIDFARELAFEVELRPELPTEQEILSTLEIMDAQLKGSGENVRSLFAFETAFLIPDYSIEVELMEDDEFVASTVPASIVKARLSHFEWSGNMVDTGFGLRLFGVDFVEPVRRHEPTAFVPLRALDLRLAA